MRRALVVLMLASAAAFTAPAEAQPLACVQLIIVTAGGTRPVEACDSFTGPTRCFSSETPPIGGTTVFLKVCVPDLVD